MVSTLLMMTMLLQSPAPKAPGSKAVVTEKSGKAEKVVVDVPLDEKECGAMVAHLVDLSVQDEMAKNPDVQKMNAEEKQTTEKLVREALSNEDQLTEMRKACVKRTKRVKFQCVMKATSVTELADCTKLQPD